MFGEELIQAFREFKSIWDPDWMMNPGKVVDPYPIDVNLRLGTTYSPPQPKTHFQYPSDDFSFAKATLRCVGVGNCRRESGGTMCPSYMVTREEKHSTRGRTHLLFEMMQGNPLSGGWRNPDVREALDLCLACKGCKGDCPVSVDVATYKAEFLSHFYEGRIRPRQMFASGLIHWVARVASLMPATANFVTQTPGISALAKLAAGFSQKRSIPPFAPETFRSWFTRREKRNSRKAPVLLWPDTFNNHFTPEIAKAAVEVLEDAGYRVEIPDKTLCCGRPLYDYGMLDLAKKMLLRTLDAMNPAIRDGIPVVGLEPSCVSVFRDEMPNLLHGNSDAARLSQNIFLLSEFLDKRADGYKPPQLKRKALLHGHCHQKALLNFRQEIELLRSAGLEVDIPDTGCCGMAGSFGYEEEHYDVGRQCGERVLLPAVRAVPDETIIITDGFSCREMIQQETGRAPLHTAQVLQMALHERHSGTSSPERLPERAYPAVQPTPAVPLAVAVGSGAVLLGGAYLMTRRLRRSSSGSQI
jgi:Fe-S oxidoreductase